MLVLTRKLNEEIIIGDGIRLTVVEIAPGRVKLGITAPRHVKVDRAEIHERKQSEGEIKSELADVPVVVNRVIENLAAVQAIAPAPQPETGLPNRLRTTRRIKPR